MQLDIKPLDSWLEIKKFPPVISGPCSAETEEQVMQTAMKLSKIPNVRIFRSGIWKPRTRPGMFQGIGEEGLKWLKSVREETGLLSAVEVANPKHVEAALKNEVDILWIGARTTVNPFSMEELAGVLKGVDIPVMIKNPVNPDLNLWIGALERFNQAGINRLAAVHRGFYFFDKTPYRNAPMWEIPIELKRLIPNMPVICDPSHICGERELLKGVAQKALDLEMDGLMIESHIDPDHAWTDPEQQVTPEDLEKLIHSLVVRDQKGNIDFETKLEGLRTEIDKIDAELIHILTRRMELIDEIGTYKLDHNITILQLKRWQNIVQDRLKSGIASGLKKDFLLKLLEIVHNESIQRQTDIYSRRNGKKNPLK
ncbi:MAG: bifunctional 3-deoxy-7-phosphoheptulonate synthase/chorismate mutase type II [Bacteroidales bacterium]|nr:bifunctional 3-deoxy-7-phosphoheptulonate synthase/chorismate mutase type II [Bacteroidales bacterium]